MFSALGEGNNDGIFLEAVSDENNFNHKSYLVQTREDLGFRRFISQYSDFRYNQIDNNDFVLIYSDGGKENLLKNHLPEIIKSIFAQIPAKLNFILLLDEDHASESIITNIDLIKECISNLNIKLLAIRSDESEIEIFSEVDDRFAIQLNLIMVPLTLERQIINKVLQNESLPKKFVEKVLRLDDDSALRLLCEKLKIEKHELIRSSVESHWFHGEPWFELLSKNFRI